MGQAGIAVNEWNPKSVQVEEDSVPHGKFKALSFSIFPDSSEDRSGIYSKALRSVVAFMLGLRKMTMLLPTNGTGH